MSSWLAVLDISRLAPAMANHLWQSTAFAGVAWLGTLALRGHSARVRYGLWLVASLKFLVPFALLFALGGMLPRPQQVTVPAVYSTLDRVEEPFATAAVTPAVPEVRVKAPVARPAEVLPAAIAAVWLGGALAVVVVWRLRWRAAAGCLRRAAPAIAGREFDLLRRVEAAQGARRLLPLRLSAERMEPGIFGVFRPVLVWPRELSARLGDEQIEAVLVHEWMHAQRRDNLTAAVHMLVEAVFWFHPLVWWMERRMLLERERACDEAVVRLGANPETYTEGLLATCRFFVESPLACVAGVTGADLKKRMVAIMSVGDLRRMTWGKKLVLATVGAAVVFAPVGMGLVTPTARVKAQVAAATMSVPQHAAGTPYGCFPVPQPELPVQSRGASFGRDGLLSQPWFENTSNKTVVALRMGWAYVLDSSLEFHQGSTLVPRKGLEPGEVYGAPDQNVPMIPQALGFMYFIDQVTLEDGTVLNADHAKIEAFFKRHTPDWNKKP